MAVPNDCMMHQHSKLSSVFRALSGDIQRYLNKSPENQAAGDTFKHRVGAMLTPNLMSLFLYRISHFLHANGWDRLGICVQRLNLTIHRINIPMQSCIDSGCFIPHPAGVTFWGSAGSGLTLYSLAVCCPKQPGVEGPVALGPRLGNRVSVGAHAVLLGPITVGDDTRIAHSQRIDTDVPAGCIVVSKILFVSMRPQSASEPEVICQ